MDCLFSPLFLPLLAHGWALPLTRTERDAAWDPLKLTGKLLKAHHFCAFYACTFPEMFSHNHHQLYEKSTCLANSTLFAHINKAAEQTPPTTKHSLTLLLYNEIVAMLCFCFFLLLLKPRILFATGEMSTSSGLL